MEDVMDRVLHTAVQAWNSHDVGRLVLLYTEDCVYQTEADGEPINGREALKIYTESLFATIPDLKIELENYFFSDTAGAAEFVMSGTPKGTLPSGLKATGKSFSVKLCSISEFQGDLIERVTNYWDRAEFMRQLGLLSSTSG